MSNLKYLVVFASGMSFVLLAPIAGFAASPAMAPKVAPKAAPAAPAPAAVPAATAPKAPAPAAVKSKPMGLAEQLALTPEQKTQLQKLKTEEAAAIANALSGEAKVAFQKRYKLTRSIGQSLRSAKVPTSQQKGIMTIRTAYNTKMTGVLDETQQAKLKSLKAGLE
jgi:Spy/CpxP family protein refolding chaperone